MQFHANPSAQDHSTVLLGRFGIWQQGLVCCTKELLLVTQSCPTVYDPMDCSPPGFLSVEFSRQEYWSGLPCPPPRDLPNPGTEPVSLKSPALAGVLLTTIPTGEALMRYTQSQKQGILTSQLFSSRTVFQLLSCVWLFTTYGLQHSRLPCPSQSPEVCSDSYLWIGDAIQPSHPLLPPSPLTLNLSQHQGPLAWVYVIRTFCYHWHILEHSRSTP